MLSFRFIRNDRTIISQIYKNSFENKQKIFVFRTKKFIIFASLKIIGNF